MPRTKTSDIHVRLTEEERNHLREKAKEARMTMSEYILALSNDKPIIVAENIPDLVVQIIKIGTNINQIAHIANAYKTVTENQINKLIANLNEVKSKLSEVADNINAGKEK